MLKKNYLCDNDLKIENIETDVQNKLLLICALSCFICRESAKTAFINKGISLTAPDVIEEINEILKIVNPFFMEKID